MQNLRHYRCTGYAHHRAFGIHAAQCKLSALLHPEVKHSCWFGWPTGHVVDCDSGLSIVPSLDPESLRDSQLGAGCSGMDLTACCCKDLNLQYDVDLSSAPYIR